MTATTNPELGRTEPLQPPAPEGPGSESAPARWRTRALTPAPALAPALAPPAEVGALPPAEGADAPYAGQPPALPEPDAAPPAPARPASRARKVALDVLTVIVIWVAALVILAGGGAVAWRHVQPQLTKPYVYDEAAFSFAGQAVARTGLPYSNVGHMQTETPGDFSKRFNWALWHPPLYVFILGHAFRHWGESETVARSLGVVCNVVTAGLIFVTATVLLRRSGPANARRGAPIFAAAGTALYVTNPFVIQSALLLDIDGTVLVASIALLTLVYVLLLGSTRSLRSPVTWFLLGLASFSLALSLWAKMTTSLALVVAAALYRLVANRPWRPWRVLIEVPVVGLAGAGLFLATWWAACQAMGMPFWLPFRVLDHELRDAAGHPGTWRENPRQLLDMVSYVALWTSPYLVVLFLWTAFARAGDLLVKPVGRLWRFLRRLPSGGERWGIQPVDFVILAGGAIGTAYLIKLAASFPKYHITMMPMWAIVLAYLLARFVPRLSLWELPVYGVVLAGMSGYFVTFVGDRYVLFKGYDFLMPLLVWPAALGFAFLVLGACLGRLYLPRQLAILGVLLTLAWSWGVNTSQAGTQSSTAYNYGVSGQRETAAYLDSILRPDQPYVAARDVAYYTDDQVYVDADTFWEHIARLDQRGITEFDGSIAGYPRVDVLALFLWDPELGRIAHSYLVDRYEVSFQHGVFIVFVRTSP